MRVQNSPSTFSSRVRLLVLALALVCLVLGSEMADRATRQSTAVSRVSRSGGVAKYVFLVPVPKWCINWFGRDLFARVTSVTYFEHGAYPAHKPENHRNYEALRDLPHIEEIDVFDSAFPVDVLENMTTLQRLSIVQNGLRDDDIHVIGTLYSLRTLSLKVNDITDSGVERLSRLRNLTELELSGNFVSDEASSELRNALPNCQIKNRWCRVDRQG